MYSRLRLLSLLGFLTMSGIAGADTASPSPTPAFTLAGAWALVGVDNVFPDGRRVELYGPNPQGLWLIDAQGRYTMQIVRSTRGRFAADDKSKGTPDEYRAAALDYNGHYGTVSVEGSTLHTHIEHASYPNWDGKDGNSPYVVNGDELTYIVAKPSSGAGEGAHGEVVWRRLRW